MRVRCTVMVRCTLRADPVKDHIQVDPVKDHIQVDPVGMGLQVGTMVEIIKDKIQVIQVGMVDTTPRWEMIRGARIMGDRCRGIKGL